MCEIDFVRVFVRLEVGEVDPLAAVRPTPRGKFWLGRNLDYGRFYLRGEKRFQLGLRGQPWQKCHDHERHDESPP
jgi:hypothetical protein